MIKRSSLLAAALVMALLGSLVPLIAGSSPITLGTDPLPAPQRQAEKKFKFTPIAKWKTHSIEVDRSTMTKVIDKSGDTLAGAVFRVTVNNQVTLQDGQKAATFVNSVIGVCGYDGVLLVNMLAFDIKGKLIKEDESTTPFKVTSEDTVPSNEMYRFLCKGISRSYKNLPGNSYT